MNNPHSRPLLWQAGCLVLIFITSMGLRFTLAFLNNEANDNHVDVVNLIISTHHLPEKRDCWSCYQPKLYYVFCAGVIEAFHIKEFYHRIKAMNMVNAFLGFFILLIIWKFIHCGNLSFNRKLLFFAFFAFNPCLAGINVQSTNDTAAIFFGVLATYAAYRFFTNPGINRAAILTIALVGGMLCKASVAVLFGITVLAFAANILFSSNGQNRLKMAKYLATLLLITFAVVPYFGGYYNNYKQYHSFTLSAWEKDPPPDFFKKTVAMRPGVRCMSEAYFTFRYFDMVRQPYINNEVDNRPLHRTSLWSQLYGRTMFMHFDQWPIGWQSQSPLIVNIGRALIILGIVPLLFFLTGIFLNLGALLIKLYERDWQWFSVPLNYYFLFITLAYLSASMFYCYTYRDFSAMKSIYIFPGFIAFIKMFCDGYAFFEESRFIKPANIALGLIIILSVADIGFLVYQGCFWG